VVLYVRRWLAAPLQMPDGTLTERDRGTPQGSAVSPVLVNLFMHYAFDAWLSREYPGVWFERYADDAVVHCVTERQAREVLAALGDRMEQVGLRLHPVKTKIVYCKDSMRRASYEHTSFTFLGFTFRPRAARRKDGSMYTRFLPAISRDALKRISGEVRSWRLRRKVNYTFAGLATMIDPVVADWMHYYGRFPAVSDVSAPGAHQRLPGAMDPQEIQATPGAHKSTPQAAGDHRKVPPASSRTGSGSPQPGCDQDDRSRMNREVHVRICGGREVRSLPATRPVTWP
jgi:RNA-directed DNA polymerase